MSTRMSPVSPIQGGVMCFTFNECATITSQPPPPPPRHHLWLSPPQPPLHGTPIPWLTIPECTHIPHICTGLMAIFLCYSLRVDCTVLYLVNNMLSICLPSRVHQVTAYLFQCSCLTHCQEFIRSPPIYFSIHVLALPIPLALLLTLPCSLSLAPACSPPSQLLSLSACHQGFIGSPPIYFGVHVFWLLLPISCTLPPYTLAPPAHSPSSSSQLPSHLPTAKGLLGHWLYFRIFSPRYADLQVFSSALFADHNLASCSLTTYIIIHLPPPSPPPSLSHSLLPSSALTPPA